MSAQLVRKIFRGSDFSRINWQKEFKVTPDQFFTITVSKVESKKTGTSQTTPDSGVEVDGKAYDLDISPDLPMTEINNLLDGFNFLEDEPDIYSVDDLKKRYV